MPNWITRGRIVAALAPPNSRAEIRDGKTLWAVNSVGKDDADSLRVLIGSWIENISGGARTNLLT